jgi:hypothetical protein
MPDLAHLRSYVRAGEPSFVAATSWRVDGMVGFPIHGRLRRQPARVCGSRAAALNF